MTTFQLALTLRQIHNSLKEALGDTILRNGKASTALRELRKLAEELEERDED